MIRNLTFTIRIVVNVHSDIIRSIYSYTPVQLIDRQNKKTRKIITLCLFKEIVEKIVCGTFSNVW